MTLSLSIDRTVHRYGSSIFPILTVDADDIGVLKVGDWFYHTVPDGSFPYLDLPNRSETDLTFTLRKLRELSSFTLSSGITSPASGQLRRSSGSSYIGAYYPTSLDPERCSVQVTIGQTDKLCGLSLQNGETTVVHDYAGANALHAVKFTRDGIAEIWEVGSHVTTSPDFPYESGDTIIIDVEDGVVRYYQVKTDRTVILRRSTRSKLETVDIMRLTGAGTTSMNDDFTNAGTIDGRKYYLQPSGTGPNFGSIRWVESGNAWGFYSADGELRYTIASDEESPNSGTVTLAGSPGGANPVPTVTRLGPKAEFMLYDNGVLFDDIAITQTYETETSIETVGVLEDFQDWKNDFSVVSTADSLTMANNEPEFTFANAKKRLRSVTPNLARRTKEDRLAYEAFFDWHGMEKNFIWVDKAKQDADDNDTEWWAKFTSPFGDRSLNKCLTAHTAQIMESYKRTYVPVLADITDPSISALTAPTNAEVVSGSYNFAATVTETNGGGIKTVQLLIDGTAVGDPVTADTVGQLTSGFTVLVTVDTTDYANGSHTATIIVTDFAGNDIQSATRNFTITN